MGNDRHKLTVSIERSTLAELDSIVEQDVRFWNRTHLINEALRMYVVQWEDDREDDPEESATDDDDDENDEEEEGE